MSDSGERVEKNIRYFKKGDYYRVIFNLADLYSIQTFNNLEDARKYKKAVLEEKLKNKTENTLTRLIEKERKEVLKESVYPYNIFEELELEYIDPDIIADFNVILVRLTPREEEFIKLFYKDNLTLEKIGKEHNITRERVRQITAKGLRRIKSLIYNYNRRKEQEMIIQANTLATEDLIIKRQLLLDEYKKTHNYTEEMKFYFGEIKNQALNDTTSIESLELSIRAENCLRRAGIKTIDDLCQKTETEMIKIRNLGRKSFKEIKDKLNARGRDFKPEE